ncbi:MULTISPECIES: hypothetical protein [Streptomyces]|uniref:RusA-like resolvase n=1 Tax=Streptomyces muensis TaxID=1077944 RepID=A0A9X1PSY9_STRM4|nr:MULTISPECIES: hypothetical protein [Streptomyces]MCF1592441.1 hypothetical protein [Streptomyces muensis]QKV98172.1 hypothetical protein HUT19_41360 [Streptomyces sp. NA02950]
MTVTELTPGPARTWRIELPTGLTLMTSNERLHHLQRSDRTRALRQAARIAAQVARVPHLERAYVTCYLRAKDRRRRDPGNWYPSAKAALDGVVDAGVLTDDDATRVIGPDMRLGEVLKTGPQLVLVVTDLTQMAPDHLTLLDPLGAAA